MTEVEINTFIEEFEMRNDHWTYDQVKNSDYNNMTLKDAIASRHSALNDRDNILRITSVY